MPTAGTDLQVLIDAQNMPVLPNAQIVLVLSNRKVAYSLMCVQTANLRPCPADVPQS